MADLRRIIRLAVWRLFAASSICGLVACDGQTPPATVEVSGKVIVQDTLPRPVADARVEITSGIDAGKFVATDANGIARISGRTNHVSISLRVTKSGMSMADLSLNQKYSEKVVELIPDVLLDLAGEHQLTIEADPLCDLPELARRRTYQATLTPQQGTPWYVYVQLNGDSFLDHYSLFATYISADAARFEIYPPGFEEDDPIVEQISPTEYVSFMGEAFADANYGDAVITARFIGEISYCAATPTVEPYQCPVPLLLCWSESHRLILTRQ